MEKIKNHLKNYKLPKVGLRTVKTVLSATIIAAVYSVINRNPCFACIGAVFGMSSFVTKGKNPGITRAVGTAVGGAVAIAFYMLYKSSALGVPAWIYLSLGLFCILYISQLFNVGHTIQPGVVMFYVVLCTVQEERYIAYIIARVIDTAIGVMLSVIINKLWKKQEDDKGE